MNIKRRMSYKKNIIICFLIVGAGVFFWWFAKHKTINDTPVYPALTFPETKPQSPESASILEQKYTNETFHFSFNYPEEFKITEKKDATGQTIIVTNPNDSREGFQIMITPFKDPVNTLTPDRIEADIPDLFITDVFNISIDSVAKGLMFESDNPDFDANSREIWFVYKGSLFQVSTYLKNDILIRNILGTWKFI